MRLFHFSLHKLVLVNVGRNYLPLYYAALFIYHALKRQLNRFFPLSIELFIGFYLTRCGSLLFVGYDDMSTWQQRNNISPHYFVALLTDNLQPALDCGQMAERLKSQPAGWSGWPGENYYECYKSGLCSTSGVKCALFRGVA